ncbi:MAG TPA: hypothetical protein VFM71_09985 [Gemmatimonadaceae bacterium]|nr:hypothetical protein [Gemmatimonadaceae bacterium]
MMTTRTLSAALLTVAAQCGLFATPLGAQIFSVPESANDRRPVTVAFSAGLLETQDRYDGQSDTFWALGQAFSYRAAVDVGIRSGAIGVAASLASVPIRRVGGSAPANSDGDIQLRQFLATFRTPVREGFHQVLEIQAGLAQWASYSGTDVLSDEEAKARNAFALLVGYGFGYTMGDRASISLVQDLGTLIGSSEGLPSGASRVVRQYTTRLGVRLRLAGQR